MSYSVNATFSSEMVKLDQTQPIEMYVLNASLSGWDPTYYVNLNQDIYGFEMSATGMLVATDTQTYTGIAATRDNIKNTTDGQISEVSISIPNVDRAMESLIQSHNYLRGRDVYILSGFAKHLPSGSDAKNIGTSPDRHAILKEKLFVDGVTSNEEVVTFTCKPKFVIKNMILPGRKFCKECHWALSGRYRGTECDPNSSISVATECNGTLEDCRYRNNSSRFGGFVSIPRRGIVIIS